MNPMLSTVRRALARHLNRAPSTIHGWQRLDQDLDITPLEVVLVALDVEELEDVIIPVEELAAVATVSELFALLTAIVERERMAEEV
jgi:hypothetical protein